MPDACLLSPVTLWTGSPNGQVWLTYRESQLGPAPTKEGTRLTGLRGDAVLIILIGNELMAVTGHGAHGATDRE